MDQIRAAKAWVAHHLVAQRVPLPVKLALTLGIYFIVAVIITTSS